MAIIHFSDYRDRRTGLALKRLRVDDHYYEYCFIPDYELKFHFLHCEAVQLADVFVNLIELKTKPVMVSLLFPKREKLEDILNWLETYRIAFNEKNAGGYRLTNAGRIVEGVLYKGLPLVLYTKGRRVLTYDPSSFVEVTEAYGQYREVVNLSKRHPHEPRELLAKVRVFLNGERLHKFSRVFFDMSKDTLIVNGAFVVADYMDTFDDSIGFFRENDVLPVLYCHDRSDVYITMQTQRDGSKLCIVQQWFDIRRLLKEAGKD